MPRRNIWQIDMGDGTWSVTCMGCRRPLYRGPQRRAARIAACHCCPGPRRRRG